MKLTGMDARIRIYDGSDTKQYFEVALDSMDFSGPLAAPTHDQELTLNRGKVDEFAHYSQGGDAPVLEPVGLSFSVTLADHPRAFDFLNLLEGNDVNGKEFKTTKGQNPRLGGISIPFAGDSRKTYTIEYAAEGSTRTFAMQYGECHFPIEEVTFSEAEDAITLSISAQCYGSIKRVMGFTEGVEV